MKTASQIVQSLQAQPRFQKLRRYRCIEKIIASLLPSTRRFVAFGYIKNKTLFFVLNHNAGKQELDNNIKMIKDVLNAIRLEACEGVDFVDIKTYVRYEKVRRDDATRTKTNVPYVERASGRFRIDMFDKTPLESVAQEIREIIERRL